jgi:hypothetical protein
MSALLWLAGQGELVFEEPSAMRKSSFLLPIIAAIVSVVLAAAASSGAAIVTKRLSTGLSASSSGNGLPQAWAGPAQEAPVIDGRLDEKAWEACTPVLLGKLDRQGSASPQTEVRFVRQGATLYLGVKAAEPNMDKLKRSVTEHDGPTYNDDSIELFLQPRSGEDYYQLVVGASGAIYDRRGHGEPSNWDSNAKAAVARGKDGWTMEVGIPLASLGVGEKAPVRWRVNVYRTRHASGKAENQAWSPTMSHDYDVPERFGQLLCTPESPWPKQEKPAGPSAGIAVEKIGEEEAVLQFDLSGLPKGTRIYRAWLQCDRRAIEGDDPQAITDIEICPLNAPFAKGEKGPARQAGPTLALVPPWYRAFDMTELVRGWIAGKPNHGIHVKQFPGWKIEKTLLDITYEGEPAGVPQQATGLKALHRSGQTFLTWKEIADPVGKDEIQWGELKGVLDTMDRTQQVRYVVYRSAQPITAANVGEAECIAEVRPASCWNTNGRNIEAGIDYVIRTRYALMHHQWNPFAPASLDGAFGRECPMERLVIEDGGKPLACGTGLYVHTATAPATAHYAVVAMIDGVQNLSELGAGNVVGPIEETPKDPQPVLQREFPKQPHFNYPEKRLHYVRWEAPPMVNLPSQYYNWSVAIPDDPPEPLKPYLKSGPKPLELSLHTDNRSYQRTQYRIEPDSIVVIPHDFPINTWWYGYHESLGTLKSFRQGIVQPYTERRILWFLDWVCKKWPVDRNRILVTGRNRTAGGPGPGGWGGAPSGVLHLAIRYPEIFNLCIPGSEARPDYAELVRNPGRDTSRAKMLEAIFGKLEWACKTDTGKSVWEELDLNKRLVALPPSADMPPVTLTGRKVPKEVGEFMALMLEKGHLIMANFNTWSGPRLIPISARGTWASVLVRAEVRKDLMLPTFSRGRAAALRGADYTYVNLAYRWKTDDIVDTAERAEITLLRQGQGERGDETTDVTLRRCQKFKVASGKKCRWEVKDLDGKPLKAAGARPGVASPATEGDVTVDKDGLLTVPGVPISDKGVRLMVTMK